MKNSEALLTNLAAQGSTLEYGVHKVMAYSPSERVRRIWARRGDIPKDLITERLNVETDTEVLIALMGDLELDRVTTLIKRGRSDAVLNDIFSSYLYYDENLKLQVLKLVKELDPTGYSEGLSQCTELIGDIVLDLWDDSGKDILMVLINDGPDDLLEVLGADAPRTTWHPATEALLNRITRTFNEESIVALYLMARVKTFSTLKKGLQEDIKKFLLAVDGETGRKKKQALGVLKWWAEIEPKPKRNPLVENLEKAGTNPENSPFKLTVDATVEEAAAFIEATKLASDASVTAFNQWAYEHRRKVDHKLVAKWMLETFTKTRPALDALIATADDLIKLRELAPPEIQTNWKLFLQKTRSFEEAKNFPLKEVLTSNLYGRELIQQIRNLDENLEIFYALADTYEGTLAEFLEVINDFKAENT